MRHTLKKSEILRGREKFHRIYKRGRKFEGRFIRCLVLDDGPPSPPERSETIFGVSVSRSVKRAVDRNRIKRLIRESYRLNKTILQIQGGDSSRRYALLFLYPSTLTARDPIPSFQEIQDDLKKILMSVSTTTISENKC